MLEELSVFCDYNSNANAHGAGINCLIAIKDNENQVWCVISK